MCWSRPAGHDAIKQFDMQYIKDKLELATGRAHLDEVGLGSLVEGEGWDYGELATPPRESNVRQQIPLQTQVQVPTQPSPLRQQQEASTKIRFVLSGGAKEKGKKDKKLKKDRKDRDRKRSKKDKRDKREKE